MNKQEIKEKANQFIEQEAKEHNYTKSQVITGLVIAVLALVGIGYLFL